MTRLSRLLPALFVLLAATPAFAQTQATATNTVSPTLEVSVNVVKAIRLTLATDTECAVTAGTGTDYAMSFGSVDALGISAGACGSKFAPATPGTDAAVYYSNYTLKPVFTSQSTTNNTISAYVSTDFAATAAGLLTIVQSNAAPGDADDLATMSKLVGSQTTVATNAANGTEITRYIGVSVAPMNGAGTLTGADAATITYTIIVS